MFRMLRYIARKEFEHETKIFAVFKTNRCAKIAATKFLMLTLF